MALSLKSPAVWGVALAGGVAILLLSRGSGGSGGTNLSAISLQAADQSNVALSGLALQGHALDLQASTQTFNASQASLATLAGMAFGFLTNSDNNATGLQRNSATINGSIANTKIAAATAITLDQQQNGNRVALANVGSETSLGLAGVADRNSIQLAGIAERSSMGLASIGGGTAIDLANIRNTLASIVTGAQLAYGQTVTVPISFKQADVSQSIAEKQANEATNQQLIKSGFGAVSSLGGGLLGAFF